MAVAPSDRTLLCVPIFVNELEQARRDMALAAEHGADIIELRIDGFDGDIRPLLQTSGLPVIVTCRAEDEGGRSDLSAAERVERLAAVADLAAYVDLELATLRELPDAADRFPRLIVSAHDFSGRPQKFYSLVAELTARRANVHKLVWTARTLRDNLEAFELLCERETPLIALCMSEVGVISRILGKKFGAFLTFASLTDGGGTAPGQIGIEQLKHTYRWDAIGPSTRVYGVVGSPVAHSMSPAIHNAAFTATNRDGVYVPLPVNAGYESFKAFMESFVEFTPLDLAGLSITIPHKENALRYLKEKGAQVDPLAQRIGAVNTIRIERSDAGVGLLGINSDYPAIVGSITAALGIGDKELAGRRVAVLGAGGTGRTAVAALAQQGATVVVYNRTREKADALAAEFNGHVGKVVAADWSKLCDSCCQIIINTTSLGMSPHVDASPFDPAPPSLSADTLVFDCVYNPLDTKLLRQSRAAGAQTLSGVEMFLRQAAIQFECWTGKPAPLSVMRPVLDARLSIRAS